MHFSFSFPSSSSSSSSSPFPLQLVSMYSSHLFRGEQNPAGFHLGDAAPDLPRSSILSPKASSNLTAATSSPLHIQFGGLTHPGMSSLDMAGCNVGAGAEAAAAAAAAAEASRFSFPRAVHLENWGDSAMAVTSPITDTSTDVDNDDRNQIIDGGQQGAAACLDSSAVSKGRAGDQKTLRRLAQNREAARKSRLRKKAYVQQLENSRMKLVQLEQELERARQQGIFIASGFLGEHGYSIGGNGALAFDMEYTRWLDDHQRQINDLRSALNSQMSDDDLRVLVDAVMAQYDEVFKLKSIGTKSDVFHMLSGMWTTPAERCFMWLGGFRSSELLKILASHLEPLTDQQLMGICNLQQSSQQAEDALSQGMEALQQSLAETLASASLGPCPGSDNVANYMGQMAIAMGKLGTLENFLRQADLLRQQTLQQMHRILTTRQAARALLAISDYFSRLRALSSLWLARPRD
ncbi:transcription factor TGA2.3-like isoform X2 [Ananas comosus]|uniref:Transcription factor TGA2.3-like isoform X2 n=1 Tax=Ananas comosus TaxID=4615 RepID=A0A6P5GSI5_ANACO|nr:transcription factor TGA2.3-like isoform X2 [Ananas comosus]